MQRLKTLMDRLESGSRLVGRLGSGVRVSVISQIFALRMHFTRSIIRRSADPLPHSPGCGCTTCLGGAPLYQTGAEHKVHIELKLSLRLWLTSLLY